MRASGLPSAAMSLPTRACLAMAIAWAGGFGLPGPPTLALPLLAIAVALGWWMTPDLERPTTRGAGIVGMLALALLLGLLARTLGRVVITTPATLWSLPIIGLALVIAGRRRAAWELALAPILVALALAASVFGASFEGAGPQPHGRVYGSPVLGVHPRQAIAVRIDGHGPHDIIADDYVDPPGGQGYDPARWAEHLETELHAIAEQHYADGPARARAAYAGAEVEVHEALVPAAERDLYGSLLGLEIRSGTLGEGSMVELVCPGQPLDPRSDTIDTTARSCPRKYLPDGSTGLGLAARFPGYTQIVGRDRARLARWLGWPSGDAKQDRRALALESGAWLLTITLACWLLARSRERGDAVARRGAMTIGLALLSLLAIALLVPPSDASTDHGGATLLAILLLLIPARAKSERAALPYALACALVLVLLAASPMVGRGDAIELLAITRDGLFELGLAWPIASALAGSLAAAALTIGAGISAGALIDRARAVGDLGRERRHAALLALLAALAVGLGLALRKPVDDLPLLHGAAALLTLALFRLRSRPQQLALTLVCTAAAAAPLLEGQARNPVALTLVGVATLLCLVLGLAQTRRPQPR